MFNKLSMGREKRRKSYIVITIVIIVCILIIVTDNLLYNKTETFSIDETYSANPTKVFSEFETSILNEPTKITIKGNVTKKVNPVIIKKGFFNYSYCYVFNGDILIDDYAFKFDDQKPFISTYITIDDKKVLFASPADTETLKIDDNVYRVGITAVRDVNFNLINFQLTLYNSENQKLANYNYDF
ncbi:hypothetical protein QE109_02115 [Fusibacter bizertensis]|uniref:DUF4860 domain-containing protein n=1 Tax=Fusibacter bizertensis TaxID=1488331 RepID=A0ABT6N926_9FIRM|nr:hypothetical protein [Fusibacter bizertensis]MDH8676921.1 hypothetical protein [Fusibacter bizertensis]